jgi:hypothetical protein
MVKITSKRYGNVTQALFKIVKKDARSTVYEEISGNVTNTVIETTNANKVSLPVANCCNTRQNTTQAPHKNLLLIMTHIQNTDAPLRYPFITTPLF